MKRELFIFSILITLSLCLSACIPFPPVPANQQVSEAYIKTAVAGTLVVERAREAGEDLSYTATPDGTTAVEETPDTAVSESDSDGQVDQDPEPTSENPWMLQNWCLDHADGCVNYDIQNRTDSWLQIELKETDSGVTGFFTIRTKTNRQITLIPGQYTVKYTWWCDGEASSFTEVKALGSWIDVFKCPQGFYQRVNKN